MSWLPCWKTCVLLDMVFLHLFYNQSLEGSLKIEHLKWTRDFMKYHLNWSYQTATTATRKLPSIWEVEGTSMAHQVAYLVKMYTIPPCLVVNTYQTGVHLIPTRRDQTWERKGVKHIQVLGIEDKRKITIIVSSLAYGSMLPLQVMFQSTTSWALPPMNEGKKNCLSSGFHLTYNSNHLFNLEITQEFVEHILMPYWKIQMEKLAPLEEQKMVWLINCWLVHKSNFF